MADLDPYTLRFIYLFVLYYIIKSSRKVATDSALRYGWGGNDTVQLGRECDSTTSIDTDPFLSFTWKSIPSLNRRIQQATTQLHHKVIQPQGTYARLLFRTNRHHCNWFTVVMRSSYTSHRRLQGPAGDCLVV